jgi:hypothetical protein
MVACSFDLIVSKDLFERNEERGGGGSWIMDQRRGEQVMSQGMVRMGCPSDWQKRERK